MNILRTYLSTFFLVSCLFAVIPSQAMDAGSNQSINWLSHVRSSLPSMQNIRNLSVQARDVVIENRYISASALAIVVVASCFYLRKRFFGRSTMVIKPIAKPVSQKILIDTVKAVKQEQPAPIVQPVDDNNKTTQSIKIEGLWILSLE